MRLLTDAASAVLLVIVVGGAGPWAGQAGNATCFPSALTAAAAFDVELMAAWGTAMGQEFFAKVSGSHRPPARPPAY